MHPTGPSLFVTSEVGVWDPTQHQYIEMLPCVLCSGSAVVDQEAVTIMQHRGPQVSGRVQYLAFPG